MTTPPPSPLPVLLVNEPTWVEIATQVALPILSLLIAGGAILHAHVWERRRDRTEREQRGRSARDAFAPRLQAFSRQQQAGATQGGAKFIDAWNDVSTAAPDDASRKLINWVIWNYQWLQMTYQVRADQAASREQAEIDLQMDFESRIRAWQETGQPDMSRHQGRDKWPDLGFDIGGGRKGDADTPS